MIYYEKKANEILWRNLMNRNYKKCLGCFRDGEIWVAFDNTTGHCHVEEFETEEMAICWLKSYYSIFETSEFEVIKIRKDLFLIPNNGLLKIQHQSNSITTKLTTLMQDKQIIILMQESI